MTRFIEEFVIFLKSMDLINIMAAGPETKVQDVSLKCTCPVCASHEELLAVKEWWHTVIGQQI